jgi:drug/metabolite transporter (DMT)-like permease
MNRRSWVELGILAALWGAVYPLIEITLRDLSPVTIVFSRVVLAALLLLPLAVRRHALRQLWRRPVTILTTVLVQSTIPLLLLTYGQRYVSAGVAGILVGAQPIFVAVLAVGYLPAERPNGARAVAGILCGFAGIVLLFGVDLRGGHHALLGGVLVAGAAACYAAGTLMIFKRHADAPPLGVATSAMLVTAGVLAVPAAFALPDSPPPERTVIALATLGIACTGATLVLFYALIVRAGPARAALAFYLSPAFAVGIGAAFLHERLTVSALAGLALIVGGSALAAAQPPEAR